MATRPSRTGEAGFTLTELLVVLAIVGLMVAAAPFILKNAMPSTTSLAAAERLAQDLRIARGSAIAQGAPTSVEFDAAAHSYRPVGGKATTLPEALALPGAKPRFRITFYPDGSANGGTVIVGAAPLRHRVSVAWLNGRVAVDE